MDVLPIAGDRVQVPVGAGVLSGIVVDAYDTGVEPMVTIEIHLPDVEPYTATFPMKYVEPAPGTSEVPHPIGTEQPG